MVKRFFLLLLFVGLTQGQLLWGQTAPELMQDAQNNLESKNYVRARALFLLAYQGFANQGDYKQAIEAGAEVTSLYYRENIYDLAFEFCRRMTEYITTEEQKQQRQLYAQRFLITRERLRMYIKLRNQPQAEGQLNTLEALKNQAGDGSLTNDWLTAQAELYYSFGRDQEGNAAFQKIIETAKSQKDYDSVTERYESLIEVARFGNNTALMEQACKGLMNWNDSVKQLTAKDELGALQQKYDESLQLIEEKESSLSTRQYIIFALLVVVAGLAIVLVLGGLMLARLTLGNRKLKQIIETTKAHSEQQAAFIQHIAEQMEPTLEKVANVSQAAAPAIREQIEGRVEALRQFAAHIQELSALESSLMTPFECKSFNVSKMGKKIVENLQGNLKPGVELLTDLPAIEIKSNAEQLERLLSYLLFGAIQHTEAGHVRLEFKRKGAHVCQFLITDTGCGIPEELKENLFTPFASTHDLLEGDGLGLPICSLVATKLNGTLSLDTAYKKGSRFVLVLHI